LAVFLCLADTAAGQAITLQNSSQVNVTALTFSVPANTSHTTTTFQQVLTVIPNQGPSTIAVSVGSPNPGWMWVGGSSTQVQLNNVPTITGTSFNVNVDTTGLSANTTVNTYITVCYANMAVNLTNCAQGTNANSAQIQVTLNVTPGNPAGPALTLLNSTQQNVTALTFSVPANTSHTTGTFQQVLTVIPNQGPSTIAVSVGSPNPGWLWVNGSSTQVQLNNVPTTTGTTFSVNVDTTGLSANTTVDTYMTVCYANMAVNLTDCAQGTTSGSAQIQVTLNVTPGNPGGNITATPNNFQFTAAAGSTTATGNATSVLITAPANLSYTMTASTQTGGNWLLVNGGTSTTGVENNNVAISVGISSTILPGLATGTYNGSISVVDTANNSTTIPVTLTVSAASTQIQIVTSSPLPIGQVGSPYLPSGGTEQLAATGSAGAARWALVGGQLPPDFVLDESNTSSGGTICVGTLSNTLVAFCSGVAQTKDQGTWNFTVQATDSQNPNNTTTKQFGLSVTALGPPSINSQTLPVAYVGQPYSYQFIASGGVPPLRWIEFSAASTFPGSFSLSSNGLLSSPQVTQSDLAGRSGGLYTFAVQVLDANNRASNAVQFNLTISQGLTITTSSPLPSGTVGSAYQGGSGLQLQATGGTGSYSWQITSGALPSGLSMPAAGFISGTPNAAVTQQQFTVQVTDVGVSTTSPPTATKTFTISVVNNALSIVQTTLPVAIQNHAYATTLTAQGGQSPYTWSLGANAVNELTIGASSGTLSGTPTNSPGSYSITVIVQDSANRLYQFTFSLSVVANLSISTTSLPNGTTGQAYSATVNAVGGQSPYSWSVTGSLPPGLNFNSSNGPSVSISGTPTTVGVSTLTFRVTDSASSSATQILTLTITASTPTISSLSPNPVTAGGSGFSLVVNGAGFLTGAAVQWNGAPLGTSYVSSTQLSATVPPNLIANAGTASVTVVNPDGGASNALTITIAAPTLSITTGSLLPTGTVGTPYSQGLVATGGTPPYKGWTVIGGSLPPGISLSTLSGVLTGLLSGVPTAPGVYAFAIQITDNANATATKQFSVTINPGPVSIAPNGIVNAASFNASGVAPGEIVTIFGANLGPASIATLQLDGRGYVTTALAGTQVMFDGVPAPMIYTWVGQVSAVVPYAVAGKTSTQVQVAYQGQSSNPVTIPVAATQPGIFTSDASGYGQGAIVNQDGTLNSPSNPASVGSFVFVYATGEGQTNPPGIDGKPGDSPAPQPVAQPVSATVGGVSTPVQYAGGVPGLVAGVLQVNIKIPQGVAPGSAVPITIQVGGQNSQTGVTLAIK